jgi:hypothetical protein
VFGDHNCSQIFNEEHLRMVMRVPVGDFADEPISAARIKLRSLVVERVEERVLAARPSSSAKRSNSVPIPCRRSGSRIAMMSILSQRKIVPPRRPPTTSPLASRARISSGTGSPCPMSNLRHSSGLDARL